MRTFHPSIMMFYPSGSDIASIQYSKFTSDIKVNALLKGTSLNNTRAERRAWISTIFKQLNFIQ